MVVFVLLTGLFTFLIAYVARLLLRQIKNGLEDDKILAEYRKNVKKNKTYKQQKTGFFDVLITVLSCCIIFGAFGFSVYTSIFQGKVTKDTSLFRVVLSSSMAEKNEKNKYLFENNLNNQFQQFDLIMTHALPAEDELKLYDIVVYEVEETLVVHRIVGIEERNAEHPNERYFLLQGDAVAGPDRFPVLYSQMKAIYKGERIPFVGSFVSFLQSPAGYVCVLLILFSVIAIPIMDGKLVKERMQRLRLLLQSGRVDEKGRLIDYASKEYAEQMAQEYVCNCAYCEYGISYYSQDCAGCPYNTAECVSAQPQGKIKKKKK